MDLIKSFLSRRRFMALSGLAVGSRLLPAFAESAAAASGAPTAVPPSFTLFYKPAKTGNIWDTWIYYHQGTFHLYYNPNLTPAPWSGWNGIALATSRDGVHWQEQGMVIDPVEGLEYLGAGAVWPVGDKFIMNFSEGRKTADGTVDQVIFFAESDDLKQWRRLDADTAFSKDERWYEPKGRWDNIWAVPRPEGGYYGYWAAEPKDNLVGIGFGESDDGVNWTAQAPAMLEGVPRGSNAYFRVPEVCSAYTRNGKYYLFPALDDLQPLHNHDFSDIRQGISTLVSDTAGGPFKGAAKNRHLLVANASHFLRFVDVNNEVLVNHHSWEMIPGAAPIASVDPNRVYMAPLKKAEWDKEDTLRLMWWSGNNAAKAQAVPLKAPLLTTTFDTDETLILEGVMRLSCNPAGLFFQSSGDQGSGFLVHQNGRVEYGDIQRDGSGFDRKGDLDRELTFTETVHFRVVRKGQITEFYLNDYLMQCYCLPVVGTGRIGLIGPADQFSKLKAWYCA